MAQWTPPDYVIKEKKDDSGWTPPDYIVEPELTETEPEVIPEVKDKGRSVYEHIFNAPEFITKKASEFAQSLTPGTTPEASISSVFGALPDIARNVINEPGATLKGFIGGAAEGLASQLSPANILTLGRGRLPNLAAKVLGAAQGVHGVGELQEGNIAEGLGDIGFGALSAASGMGHGRKSEIDLPIAPKIEPTSTPRVESKIPSISAKQRVDDLVRKGIDNLTPEEVREITRLDSQLKKVSKIVPQETVPTEIPITKALWKKTPDEILRDSQDPNFNQGIRDSELADSVPYGSKQEPIIRQNISGIKDAEGRIIAPEQNLAPPVEGLTPQPEQVIPPIRPETPESIARRQTINESGVDLRPEVGLPVSPEVPQTAKFSSFMEDGTPLYDIPTETGPSTVSKQTLIDKGIEIPETPPFTGKRDIPAPVREVLEKSGIPPEEVSSLSFDDAISKAREIRRGGQLDPKKQVPINKDTEVTRNPTSTIEKLKLALKESSEVSSTQEHLRSLERSRRAAMIESVTTPGMKGQYERLGMLKGELPSATITNRLDANDIDLLADAVTNSELMPYQKMNARDGLGKLLAGKPVPPYEAKLLSQVFGDDMEGLIQLHGGIGLSGVKREALGDAVNASRTLMSTFDASAPLRQGITLAHKKEFWDSYSNMFKYYGDKAAFDGLQQSLEARPNFHLGEQAGLFLSDVGKNLGHREEKFLSQTVKKIPGVKGSERAYVGFLNKLRADTYDNLIDQAKKVGVALENADGSPTKDAIDIAKFVNNATGRGDIGFLKKNADLINGIFFSPSLAASRLRLLNPLYYIDPKVSPIARKESLKSLLAMATAGSTITGLLKQAGANVSLDPTSSDFMKAKIGDTRVDSFGGFQQYVVAANRLISGKTTSTSGKTFDLGTSKYPNPTRATVFGNLVESKLSPIASLALTLARGSQAFPPGGIGEKVGPNKISAEIINRFVPMIANDLTEIYNEDPDVLPFGLKVALGVGVASGIGINRFESKKSSPFRINTNLGIGDQ